jgi:hypothetical protein
MDRLNTDFVIVTPSALTYVVHKNVICLAYMHHKGEMTHQFNVTHGKNTCQLYCNETKLQKVVRMCATREFYRKAVYPSITYIRVNKYAQSSYETVM